MNPEPWRYHPLSPIIPSFEFVLPSARFPEGMLLPPCDKRPGFVSFVRPNSAIGQILVHKYDDLLRGLVS